MNNVAHLFEKTTGAYLVPVEAQESPRRPGAFLRPANAAFAAPIGAGQHQRDVFAHGATEKEREALAEANVNAWSIQDDWRGVLLFDQEDGHPVGIEDIGVTPEAIHATALPRPSPDHVWEQEQADWVVDPAKAQERAAAQATAQKLSLLNVAALHIASLQFAVDMDMATAEESAALLAWKRHSVELARVHQQPGYPTTIVWPDAPAS
jgi:tail fiber assembly protein lambda gpK